MIDINEAMTNIKIAEAYWLAMKVEEDGYAFYDKAISMTENARAKEDLEFLRDQEKGHKMFFEKLLKDTGEEYTENPDSPLYAWVKENLIDPVKKSLEENPPNTYSDALLTGMTLEDRSIELYKKLAKVAEAKENKKAIKNIIKEERKHKKFLTAVLRYSVA